MTLGCAANLDAIRADYERYLERVPDMPPYPDQMVEFFRLVRRAIDARQPELCRQTARTFHEHGVASVPTLVASGGTNPHDFVADAERMGLLPRSVQEEWRAMAEGRDPVAELLGPASAASVENVRILHEEDVTILAGTDVGNPFLVPGLSLHRELERLSAAGLSPLEALQGATILPARVFGLEDSLGTVEAGKLADLVLLEADPLEEIKNTRRIRAVVVDGQLYRRADLDRLLIEARSRSTERQALHRDCDSDVDGAILGGLAGGVIGYLVGGILTNFECGDGACYAPAFGLAGFAAGVWGGLAHDSGTCDPI
jgi:hypothetical protein